MKLITKKVSILIIAAILVPMSQALFAEISEEGKHHQRKAQEYIKKNDTDNAIHHLEQAIYRGVDDGVTYGQLGSLYKWKGRDDEAMIHLKAALQKLYDLEDYYIENDEPGNLSNVRQHIERVKRHIDDLD